MVWLLVLLFVVVPILELAFFVQVAGLIGVVPAIALVIVVSATGAWLVKQEGLSAWQRAQLQLGRGEVPASEVVNGVLIVVAGALLLAPGFLTDMLGIFLLLPPTRALVRLVLLRRFERRILAAFGDPLTMMYGAPFGAADATASRVRTSAGRATYGDVVDVHEVADDGPDPERGRP